MRYLLLIILIGVVVFRRGILIIIFFPTPAKKETSIYGGSHVRALGHFTHDGRPQAGARFRRARIRIAPSAGMETGEDLSPESQIIAVKFKGIASEHPETKEVLLDIIKRSSQGEVQRVENSCSALYSSQTFSKAC